MICLRSFVRFLSVFCEFLSHFCHIFEIVRPTLGLSTQISPNPRRFYPREPEPQISVISGPGGSYLKCILRTILNFANHLMAWLLVFVRLNLSGNESTLNPKKFELGAGARSMPSFQTRSLVALYSVTGISKFISCRKKSYGIYLHNMLNLLFPTFPLIILCLVVLKCLLKEAML